MYSFKPPSGWGFVTVTTRSQHDPSLLASAAEKGDWAW